MQDVANPASTPEYLKEENVALLESHWAELPEEAHVESTDGGWKLRLHGPGKIFSKAGFINGEEVTAGKLLKHACTAWQKSLVERLLAIFEHIKKS